ncbi:hypothetical protein HanHA300_Chr05g0167551 [Helianthus annuus]|nr:hypothetical protein HanHA300_Chr05g0167551 [Helianthus annuus]KAJ0583868.1 hypothetical protein HanHA89_Chr05g0181621 [Helianthus annuus]
MKKKKSNKEYGRIELECLMPFNGSVWVKHQTERMNSKPKNPGPDCGFRV